MEKITPNFTSLIELEIPFKDIQFSEKDHTYKINGEPAKYSVTKLLHKYQKEFPETAIATAVSKREGISIEDVLDKWKFQRDYANHKGTEFHLYIENFLMRKKYSIDREAIDIFFKEHSNFYSDNSIEKYYLEIAKMLKNFLYFYDWYKEDHHLIKSEFVVGDPKTKLVGTMDNLSYNKKTNELVIFDYKTNKKINRTSKYKNKLLSPFNHLDDCEYNKYALQIWLYKLILERNTPFSIGDSYVVWFSDEGFEKIKVPNFRKEAELILEIEEKNVEM
jgi:ATP-dependent exoDNAse (exonuclease V) beta subunit